MAGELAQAMRLSFPAMSRHLRTLRFVGPTARRAQGAPAEHAKVTSKVFISLRVPADPTRALEAFTREISSWVLRIDSRPPSGRARRSADPRACRNTGNKTPAA